MSNNKPLISIAMATYNGEKYLKEQLESIYAQTYENIEVIVCDDRSMDRTVDILDTYHREKGLKYYVNEENLGFVRNFEKAINLCTGEYIALADQDDVWLSHKLSTLLENINGYDLICSDCKLIDETNSVIHDSFKVFSKMVIPNPTDFRSYIASNVVTGCTAMFKRDLLNLAFPIPKVSPYHDWWLSIVAASNNGMYYLEEPLILYRQHTLNHTGANQAKGFSYFNRVWRAFSFFSQDRAAFRKDIYTKIQNNVQAIFASKISANVTEHKYFLEQLCRYANDMAQTQLSIKSFIFAIQHSNALFFHEKNLFFTSLRHLLILINTPISKLF